jgi:hypothetical protein
MMTFVKMCFLSLVVALLSDVGPLWAQGFTTNPTNPANRPAVSPYVNILRGGATAGVNYYGLVKPEVDFRNAITQNQQQIAANGQSISNLGAESLTTGHSARYMTHWAYFMNNGAGPNAGAFRRQQPIVRPQLPTLPPAPNASLQGYGPGAGVAGGRR